VHRLLTGVRPYFALILLCLAVFVPGQNAIYPLDRDEARYMQASKQMLESGDYVSIYYQDTPRNKKPVGIYWAQSASVAAAHALFPDLPETARWPYRIPSVLGAIFAVLMTYGFGKYLFDKRVAFVGAALLATTVIMAAEAHQAKTDAAQLACVVAMMGIFGRLYMQARKGPAVPNWQIAALWVAFGLGTLIKGPVPLMILALTAITLMIADRRWRWLGTTRPVMGLGIAIAIVAPWFIAIMTGDQSSFVSDAVQKDLIPKLLSGQEAHGGIPGLYALIAIATLWPASLFLLPALIRAFKERAQPGVRFCLAWLIPNWIVFELVPTKLPHYPLPVYPAICLLIAAALFAVREDAYALFQKVWVKAVIFPWMLIGGVLGIAATVAPFIYGDGFLWVGLPVTAVGLGGAYLVFKKFWQDNQPLNATAIAIGFAVLLYAGVFAGVMPNLSQMWVGPRLASAIEVINPERDAPVYLSGYHEPSAVFMIGTDTKLVNAADVAAAMAANPKTIGIVEDRNKDEFLTALKNAGIAEAPTPAAELDGFNYSKGRKLHMNIYQLAE